MIRFAALVLILCLSSLTAYAQPSPDELTPAEREKVGKLLLDAKSAFDDGEYVRAIEKLEKAYVSYPSPDILFRIGQSYERLGEFKLAVSYYRRYVEASPNASDKGVVVSKIELLEEKLAEVAAPTEGILDIASTPSDATVEIEGRRQLWKTPAQISLPPAEYSLKITRRGFEPESKTITIEIGQTAYVDLSLRQVPDPNTQKRSAWPWVMVGAGGLALVGSSVAFGISVDANQKISAYDDARNRAYANGSTVPDRPDDYDALTKREVVAQRTGIVTAVSGAAFITGGLIWWFASGPSNADKHARIQIGATHRTISISGQF